MAQLIFFIIIMIVIGVTIYIFKYKNKEKPKIAIKRNYPSYYFKDYLNLKLYLTQIAYIVFGVIILITILILELFFEKDISIGSVTNVLVSILTATKLMI